MSGWERNVCVHYAYEPLPRFPATAHAKSWNSGDAGDAYMSELIFIMCAIEKSKLLFTLELVSLRRLAYQSWGELSHRGRRDRGYNCTHVASPRWLVEAIKYGHLCEQGSRRWARRCIFEEGREGWWWWWWGNIPVKYAVVCVYKYAH